MDQHLKDKFTYLFGKEWFEILEPHFESPQWGNLTKVLIEERKTYNVYPEQGSDLLFQAFRTTPFSKVRVVILGQDPYHDGSYDGYAFSNTGKLRLSPSLQNILKEVEADVYDGFKLSQDSNLERWAKQGVLLINTAHTVRAGEPASHLYLWMAFTQYVIHKLAESDNPIVWMLWGKKAQSFAAGSYLTKHDKNLILTAAHPSPFSAHSGFFGCKHFTQANDFLTEHKLDYIEW